MPDTSHNIGFRIMCKMPSPVGKIKNMASTPSRRWGRSILIFGQLEVNSPHFGTMPAWPIRTSLGASYSCSTFLAIDLLQGRPISFNLSHAPDLQEAADQISKRLPPNARCFWDTQAASQSGHESRELWDSTCTIFMQSLHQPVLGCSVYLSPGSWTVMPICNSHRNWPYIRAMMH